MSRTFFEKIKKVERSGEGGIRTHGTRQEFNGFQDRLLKPLGHPSRTLLYFIRKSTSCQERNSQFAGQQHGKRTAANTASVFSVDICMWQRCHFYALKIIFLGRCGGGPLLFFNRIFFEKFYNDSIRFAQKHHL